MDVIFCQRFFGFWVNDYMQFHVTSDYKHFDTNDT